MSILKIRDNNGNVTDIPAIRGQSAYQYAKDGGYTGTESEFSKDINPNNINANAEKFITSELAKRGQLKPEFANNIEECVDTSKLYVLPDGYIYGYMPITLPGEPLYTNLATTFEIGRINSSGNIDSSATAATTCADYFDFTAGNVVRVKGLTLGGYNVGIYSSNKTVQTAIKPSFPGGNTSNNITWEKETDEVYKFTNISNNAAFIRFSGVLVASTDDVIITVNEEIKEGEPTIGYQWASTGHAFVPADYEDRIVSLEAESKEHEERITLLEINSNESNKVAVPTFWEEAVNECISKIKALQVGKNCITFPFFSDNHQRNGYAGVLIAKVMKECNIPYCFYGGDSISNGYIDSEETMIAQDKAFDAAMSYIPNGRFCRAVGNHDGYWAVSADEKHYYTRDQIYELFLREESISQNKHFGDDGTYYYIDDIASKTRFIVLNTNGIRDESGDVVGNTIDSTQLSWLQNTALLFNESGWAIVFISHQPISNHYHSLISNAAEVRTIINNYIDGSATNKADVVGWFSGHIHRDRIYTGIAINTTDDSEGELMGFTQVTITSDHTGIAYDDTTKHTVSNDNKSHAIDFVTINKSTKTVNLTRLGIGEDRRYTY